ncbi:MAG: 2-oxoglutarate and iron-dependent oxygenase domain-containing protein, partial [Pseudomonadota bacterium]
MTDFVPTLPLAHYTHGTPSQKASFCEGLFSALTQTGFVILTDHGIELDRLTATYQTVETFFTQAEAEKLEFMVGMDGQRGYTPFGREHAKDNPFPDLKEFWHVGREEIRPNIWPSRPASFQRDVTWLYDALDKAGLSVLEALTTSLHLPKDYFEEMAMGGNSILRLLHYPPLADDADPACVRAAAHEDINLITLLVA